jgi:predicted ATPase
VIGAGRDRAAGDVIASGPDPRATEDDRPGDGPDPGLFGRRRALTAVQGVIDQVATGRGAVVLVDGEAGIGKSRFVEAVVALAERRGFRAGRGVWEAEGNPPLWGWTRAVRQLTGRTDVLDVGQTDASSASFRQADALLEALSGTAPAVLALDDLHWADAESLRLLRRLAGELDTVPQLVVLATRNAPSEVGPLLAETLALLARLGVHRVNLSGLDAGDVRDWIASRHGITVGDEVAERIIARTDGNPFFVTELVRLLVAEGVVAQPGAASWSSVPTGVRDVVRQRLAQAEPEVARVAGIAAGGPAPVRPRPRAAGRRHRARRTRA